MPKPLVFHVPLSDIHVAEQPREVFDEQALKELAQSIVRHGVLQPLIVSKRGEELHLVDGGRRYRACSLAGCVEVPVIVHNLAAGAETTIVQMVANVQRADLSPMEKANALASILSSTGISRAALANEVGLSEPTISRLLRLLELPPEVQAQIASGKIPAASAYELTQIADPLRQAALAAEVSRGTLGPKGLRRERRNTNDAVTVQPCSGVKRVTMMLNAEQSITVAGPGLDLDRVTHLLEDLLARVRKVRPHGISLATFTKVLRDGAKQHRPTAAPAAQPEGDA